MRKIKEKKINSCPACSSKLFLNYTFGYDYEYQTCLNKWNFVCCRNCKLLYLKNRPDPSTLKTIYPKAYYSFNYDKINFIARYGKFFLDEIKFKKFLPRFKKNDYSILDIGCGDGRYLELMYKKFKLKKSNCHGLDFKNKKLETLKKEGYKISYENFVKYNKKKKFDIITMFHVIEHVQSPEFYLKKIRKLLKPGGSLVVETPNYDSLDARIFKNSFWGGYHIPRHFVLFNDKNLIKFSKKMDFNIKKKFFLTGHYFWMMSFFNIVKNRSKILKYVFNPFNIFRLPFLVLFTLLDIIRNKIGFKTSTILLVLEKK